MKARYGGGIVYLLVILMNLLMRLASSIDVYSAIGVDADLFFTLVTQILCFGVLAVAGWFIIVGRCQKEQLRVLPRAFCITKCGMRNVLLTLLVTVPMVLITGFAASVWTSALSFIGFRFSTSAGATQSVGVLIAELALTAVLPGVFEELTHRGELFATYRDSGWKVVIVSALLFALMHQNIVQTAHTFALGLCLALLTYYTGSIFPAMFVHFFNNFISVVQDYTGVAPVFNVINVVRQWLYGTVAGMAVLCLLVAGAVALIAVVFARMRKDAVKAGRLPARPFAPAEVGALPLHRDIVLWLIIAVGVAATLFSFVWGMV